MRAQQDFPNHPTEWSKRTETMRGCGSTRRRGMLFASVLFSTVHVLSGP